MDEVAARRVSRGWTIWSVVGIAGWIAAGVIASVTNDDPSDATPVLRAFAIAGAVFFAVTFGAAAVQMWRSRSGASEGLYRRLALTDVSQEELRTATRGMAGVGPVYLAFGAVTTGLMLLAIGLNDEHVFPILLWTAVGLVVVWAIYAVIVLRRAFTASDALMRPLGLRLTGVPTWLVIPSGGSTLVGAQTFGGERHGREVAIHQEPRTALTGVAGAFPEHRWTDPRRFGSLTGEAPGIYRRVTVTTGPDGVLVTRTGSTAARHLYHDLLLAEAVAADLS